MKFIISLILFTLCSVVEGKGLQEYDLSSEVKKIRLQVQNAHIKIHPLKSKKKKLKLKYLSSLKTEEKDGVFIISEKKFPSKKTAWESVAKPPVMEVWVSEGLSFRAVLFQGRVEVKKRAKMDLFISIIGKGSIEIKNTQGSISIFQAEGDIKIESHKGDISIQSENSRVQLKSCKGRVNIHSFKGRLEIGKSSGHFTLKTYKSPLFVNNFTGRLDFQQEKGGVYLKPMIGSVSGYSKEGEIIGRIKPKDVILETKTSRIQLSLPHSRSWVTAETWEGRLFTPSYFNRLKTGGVDRAKGRLRAGKKKIGNVSLKSHSGSIRFYQ